MVPAILVPQIFFEPAWARASRIGVAAGRYLQRGLCRKYLRRVDVRRAAQEGLERELGTQNIDAGCALAVVPIIIAANVSGQARNSCNRGNEVASCR